MEIKDYIERLSAVSALIEEIEKDSGCKVHFCNCDYYWALRVVDSMQYEAYSIDFERLDDAVKHLDAIRVGVNLMCGKDI